MLPRITHLSSAPISCRLRRSPHLWQLVGECDAPRVIDCSALALTSCPTSEALGKKYPAESLQLLDPDDKSTVVGCYSPCAKLTYSQWGQGHSNTPESPEAQDYCCATPPISPEQAAFCYSPLLTRLRRPLLSTTMVVRCRSPPVRDGGIHGPRDDYMMVRGHHGSRVDSLPQPLIAW